MMKIKFEGESRANVVLFLYFFLSSNGVSTIWEGNQGSMIQILQALSEAQALSKGPGLFLFLRRGVSGAKESVEEWRGNEGVSGVSH